MVDSRGEVSYKQTSHQFLVITIGNWPWRLWSWRRVDKILAILKIIFYDSFVPEITKIIFIWINFRSVKLDISKIVCLMDFSSTALFSMVSKKSRTIFFCQYPRQNKFIELRKKFEKFKKFLVPDYIEKHFLG